MIDPVRQYADDVLEGRMVAGHLVRAACQRHIQDLQDGKDRGLWWDWPAAQRVINYFHSVLHLIGGEFEGKPFDLHPSQMFIVGSLFGWKDAKNDDARRFRIAFIEEGKGNGKSPLSGGLALYMLTADGEMRAECYAAACDKDQAKIPFRDAVAMVDQSPSLDRRIVRSGGRGNEWNLAYHETGSFFRPISAEYRSGRGKSGPRPHFVLLDEIHEHPSNVMVEMMRAGVKGRRQALIFMITNTGVYDPSSVYSDYHDYSAKVLKGDLENDSFFAYICGLDPCAGCLSTGRTGPSEECPDCDDYRNPAVWIKANPLLGISVTEKYLTEQVREAQGMPSKESLVKRLNFCVQTESLDPFVTSEVWRKNGGVGRENLDGRKCWGGLDLSGKKALTSLVLQFEPNEDGSVDILSFFWAPRDGLKAREEQDRVPYREWVHKGHLYAVPGPTIDHTFIATEIGQLAKRYAIQSIGFDPWRIDDLVRAMEEVSVDVHFEPHAQGFKEMTPSIEALEDLLLKGKLRHRMHPILTWNINNVRVVKDAAGNRKFDKKKSTGRIDGAQALAMAAGQANRAIEPEEPKYQFFTLG